MLYEGRSPSCGGMIGIATSINLIDWNQSDEPVVKGTGSGFHPRWDKYIVPDDIIRKNDK